MRFEQIERLLGEERVTGIHGAIVSALEASGGDHIAVCALREFLVSMLAAIVTTRTYLPQSQQLAAEDAAQLNALVRMIRKITPYQSAAPARVTGRARLGANAAAVVAQPSNVIAFRSTALPRPAPEVASATGRESDRHAASVTAAASRAIARKKELTAQRREVVARSQALLAHSRSLRTSLEAVQLGRHF